LGNQAECRSKGSIIFKINEAATSTIYLTKGIASLSDSQGKTVEVDASTAKAKFPLATGVKCVVSPRCTIVYLK
jgi:hypothetical protein